MKKIQKNNKLLRQLEGVLRNNHKILKKYLKIQNLKVLLNIVQDPIMGEKGFVPAKTDFEKRIITLDISDWHQAIQNHVHELVHMAICEPLRPVINEINPLFSWLKHINTVAQRENFELLMTELIQSGNFIKKIRKRINFAINVESYEIAESLANILADELAIYPLEIIRRHDEHWCNHCFNWTLQSFLGEEKRMVREYGQTFQIFKCESCGKKALK